MLRISKTLLIAAVLSVFAQSASVYAKETLTLSYNQWFPSQHWSQKNGVLAYFKEVAAVTEGRGKIIPSAKPLVAPSRNFQAVTSGIADLAWGPHGYMAGAFPLTEMVEFPFINKNAGVSSQAYWRLFTDYFQPAGLHDEVVTLAMHVTSGVNFHMKSEPVDSVPSLQGKKIRISTSVASEALKKLGVVPISGSLGELREFLSRGGIDGTGISDELSTGFKVDKYIHEITQIPGGLYSNSAFLIINKNKWGRISKQDQAAIMAISGKQLSARMGRLWHENDQRSRQGLQHKLGSSYRIADEALLAAIRMGAVCAAAPVIQDAIVTGHNEEAVGLLAFASLDGCLSLCPDAAGA